MIAINYFEFSLWRPIILVNNNISSNMFHVVFLLERDGHFTCLVSHGFGIPVILKLLLIKLETFIDDKVAIGSLKHCSAWMQLGVNRLVRCLVGPLLRNVVFVVSFEFFHLDVVDAVVLWEVEVNGVYGKGEVRALTIFASWLDVEASIFAKFFGLEIGWVVVTFDDFELVFTT